MLRSKLAIAALMLSLTGCVDRPCSTTDDDYKANAISAAGSGAEDCGTFGLVFPADGGPKTEVLVTDDGGYAPDDGRAGAHRCAVNDLEAGKPFYVVRLTYSEGFGGLPEESAMAMGPDGALESYSQVSSIGGFTSHDYIDEFTCNPASLDCFNGNTPSDSSHHVCELK